MSEAHNLDRGQQATEPHGRHAPVDPSEPGPANVAAPPTPGPPAGFDFAAERERWQALRVWSSMLTDAQHARISIGNRIGSATVDGALFDGHVDTLKAAERGIALGMKRAMRTTVGPNVRAWQQTTPGIGEHLLARLLGDTLHPAIAWPHHWEGTGADRVLVAEEPYLRGLYQWWSYCGMGDAGRRKRAGMTADEAASLGRPSAKMLARLLAEASMKAGAHGKRKGSCVDDGEGLLHAPGCGCHRYRLVYDETKARHVESVTKGHAHNRALRIVAKEILRDLWIAARADLTVAR